jgi:hypothetical protein
MSATDRAARIAVFRQVLDIMEADESLPLPFLGTRIAWSLYAAGNARLAARIEAALPCELTGAPAAGNEARYALTGEIGGIAVVIEAWTSDMAEKRVTGTRTAEVDVVEWVRLPVQDETPESGTQA